MRAGVSLLVLLAACKPEPATGPEAPATVRDRLAAPTQLVVSASQSHGSIVASRYSSGAWRSQEVPLAVDMGDLTATADRNGVLTVSSLELAIAPIEIPSTVLGHAATLTQLRLGLVAPVSLPATWSDDDQAHAAASLELQLSWSLTVDGTALPLGAPKLPPIPVTVDVSGDGGFVMAQADANAPGDLWNWADLVKLSNLSLSLDASTN
jgi:hypothetical protein